MSVYAIGEEKTKPEQSSRLLLRKVFEDFPHGCELIHEVRAPQTVADLYQQKDNPSCKDN